MTQFTNNIDNDIDIDYIPKKKQKIDTNIDSIDDNDSDISYLNSFIMQKCIEIDNDNNDDNKDDSVFHKLNELTKKLENVECENEIIKQDIRRKLMNSIETNEVILFKNYHDFAVKHCIKHLVIYQEIRRSLC